MRKIVRYLTLHLLFLSLNFFGQNTSLVVVLKKNEYQLKKVKNNEYFLTIFNKSNIEYNRKKGLKYQELYDGRIVPCDGCKDEYSELYILKANSNRLKLKQINSQDFFDKNLLRTFEFHGGYFNIDGNIFKYDRYATF